jgi:alcohol dehydrogenase (cytochrome c)
LQQRPLNVVHRPRRKRCDQLTLAILKRGEITSAQAVSLAEQTGESIAGQLNRTFVVVKVNVSEQNKNESFLKAYPEYLGVPHFYVLDANTGKFENGFPFVKKITWAKGLDKDGRPIYDPANRPGDPTKGADGKKGEMVFSAPSFLGGKNQMPMAYSPDTGLFYVPANEWGMEIWNEPITYKKGAAYLGAGFTIKTIDDKYIGALRAFDPKTGKMEWEVTNNAPLWGGVLTTKGGLVFWGTPEGYLQAADAKTGKILWKFQTGSGVVAPPITWSEKGEQYIAVASGWGGAVPLWGGESL